MEKIFISGLFFSLNWGGESARDKKKNIISKNLSAQGNYEKSLPRT